MLQSQEQIVGLGISSSAISASIMRILVTAGPTREPIDPVRFISNRSTGKMGYAVADACANRGHSVILVSGPVSLMPPADVKVINVETAAEMLTAVKKHVRWCDAMVMTAAVSDFRPETFCQQKMKKRNMPASLKLQRTVDILKSVKSQKGTRTFVGFAAETSHMLAEARRKLKEKGVDMVVANDVTRKDSGFGTETNRVVIVYGGGITEKLPLMSKSRVAERILAWIETRQSTRNPDRLCRNT